MDGRQVLGPVPKDKHFAKPKDFAQRLQRLVDEAGSGRALAELSGVSKNAVHLWLQGSEPSREKLVSLAAATGVRVEWLATGSGPMRADLVPEGYVLVPRYAGERNIEGVDFLALKENWIQSLPGAPIAEHLLLIEASGDAMAPYIESGDLVLINAKDRNLRDGVWALMPPPDHLGAALLLVRRVRDEGGGNFRLLCDNKDFESTSGQSVRYVRTKVVETDVVETTSAEKALFGIFGRAIWKGSRIP